jgi:AcrR family transcriptional regulator
VQVVAEFGELGDVVDPLLHLPAVHPEEQAPDQDVFAAGDLGVQADAEVEHRRDPADDPAAAAGRLVDAGQQPQQGGFAGAVVPDQADAVPFFQRQRDVLQGLDDRRLRAGVDPATDLAEDLLLQRAGLGVENREVDIGVAHLDAHHVATPFRRPARSICERKLSFASRRADDPSPTGGSVRPVSKQPDGSGFRPPQQARSRASLQKVLAAAEHVLAHHGIEEFTVGAVAEQAEMSVGAIYRRFSGKDQLLHAVKDQLLTQLETNVREALRTSEPGLREIVGAFTQALARTFASHDRIFSELLDGQRAEGRDRGLAALAAIQHAFVESVRPGLPDISREDPEPAVRMAARTIIGACVHRAATGRYWPDHLSWTTWAVETTELTLAYLTAPADRGAARPG